MLMRLQRRQVLQDQEIWLFLELPHHYIDIPFSSLENAVRKLFGKKGEEIVEVNLKALRAGRNA